MSVNSMYKKISGFISDFLTLIAFFVAYKYTSSLIIASFVFLTISVFRLIMDFLILKRLNKTLLISTALLIFFIILTLLFQDTNFIKMKPTFVYLLFALILFVTSMFNIYFIKSLLQKTTKLQNVDWTKINSKEWKKITAIFYLFFVVLAISNEIVWRNYNEEFWVKFKVIITPIITVIFVIITTSYILNKLKIDKDR